MAPHQHAALSYCDIDGRLIFLDIDQDRYYRLSDSMERRFRDRLHRGGPRVGAGTFADTDDPVIARLLAASPPSPSFVPPTHSAMETGRRLPSITATDLLDTAFAVVHARMQLSTRRLSYVLARLEALRGSRVPRAGGMQDDATRQRLTEATAAFMRNRPYLPVATCCLIDSIALIGFLARRGLAARLVFAVTGTPFSAHCWAQAGALVLNDTVGNACAHTPIRVV
jgi:hypothetical protein